MLRTRADQSRTLNWNEIGKAAHRRGGSNNRLLNQLTADYAGIIVEAGPSEATAIGNVAMQMLSTGQFSNIEQARNVIKQSFPCETFTQMKISKTRWNGT